MSSSGRRRRITAKRGLGSFAAFCAGLALLAGAQTAGASTFEKRPVLFVHGFESAGSNFRLAGDALRKQRLRAELGDGARL